MSPTTLLSHLADRLSPGFVLFLCSFYLSLSDVWQLARDMEGPETGSEPTVEVVTLIDQVPTQDSIPLASAPDDVLELEDWPEVGSK